MRLYSLTGATAVTHEGTRYEPADDDGGFDFPPALEQHMHTTHIRGQKQWETSIERQHRLIAEEAARRADPATLLDAVLALQKQAAAGAVAKAAEKPSRRRARKAEPETTTEGDDDQGDEDDQGDDPDDADNS